MKTEVLRVGSKDHREAIDLTIKVAAVVKKAAVAEGVCQVFVQHTTAGVAISEASEGTAEDLLEVGLKMIPAIRFRHSHDPSHAPDHMASSIIGPSVSVPIIDGKLALGTWQHILLLEWNGPRQRSVVVQVLP